MNLNYIRLLYSRMAELDIRMQNGTGWRAAVLYITGTNLLRATYIGVSDTLKLG